MFQRSVLSVALLVGLCACHRGVSVVTPSSGHEPETLRIRTTQGPVRLRVELAISDTEKQEGLMGRTSLRPSAGMAFLFDTPTTVRFWMKDTLIPLSIAFWDEQGRIVAIDEMAPCTQDPCTTYGPEVAYRGAVEANTGFFADHGVAVGDTVGWEPAS
jgi:uncharacterized membrane protein (UPF0127 family)